MKRGTLLLAVALLLQGSTSWAVLGDTRLSKAQRRAARKARQEAHEAAQQVAAAQAESAAKPKDECFQFTFGPQPKPTDYASDNNETVEAAEVAEAIEQTEAVLAEVDSAVSAAQGAADTKLAAKTDTAAKGWFTFGKAQTSEERHAQGMHKVLPAVTAKAQKLAEIRTARETHKSRLPLTDIQTAAKAMKQAQIIVPAHEVYQEQDERGVLPLLKEVKAKAQAAQKARDARSFQDPYKAVSVEYDSEYSDVEGKDTEEYNATQRHYSTWTRNLRDPRVLLKQLQNESVAPEYQQHFENLVASAFSILAEQAEANIQATAQNNVSARRECAKANAELMKTLNAIARAARLRKLNLTKASKKMALALQTMNDAFVYDTAEMARAEVANTQIVLNDEDFRFATAARVVRRAKRTKHACLQGEKGSDNIAVLTRAIATLTRELEAGSADIDTVASLLDLLNSPKGIHVAPHVVKQLHEALATVATQNNNEIQQELTAALALNARLAELREQVSVYAERFTNGDITEAEPETEFLEGLELYLPKTPANDTGDWNDWN